MKQIPIMFSAFLFACMFITAKPVIADEKTIANFTGLDGIVSHCIVSTKRKFAARMCTDLAKNGAAIADVNGVPYFFAGSRFAGDELPSKNDADQVSQIQNPLIVEYFIRGTQGKTAGASIRIVASLHYQQAIEQSASGKPQIPRTGKLVLWEEAAVANGPAKRMGKALSAHMTKKLKTLISLFAQRTPE